MRRTPCTGCLGLRLRVKGEESRGFTCQSHGTDALVRNFLRYQALSAEVAAKLGVVMLGVVEERDALAPMVILA